MSEFFLLPKSTVVDRVIPKNAFDKYTNTKQKRQFVDLVEKIRWTNKVATATVNLPSQEVREIQIFQIELKLKDDISSIISVIDRSIPYHIVFVVRCGKEVSFSASQKHPHPANENISVVDWTFSSPWHAVGDVRYQLNLRESVDFVFQDFCRQLAGVSERKPIQEVIKRERKIADLKREIKRLEAAISREGQFNKKVELNVELQKKNKTLLHLIEK